MNPEPSFPCPCCGFITLADQGGYDICAICWCEDDGQDDPYADEVWGGPNYEYSLTHARQNFLDHGHMYDTGNGIEVVEKPSQRRLDLMRFVEAVGNGATPDQERLNRLISGAFAA